MGGCGMHNKAIVSQCDRNISTTYDSKAEGRKGTMSRALSPFIPGRLSLRGGGKRERGCGCVNERGCVDNVEEAWRVTGVVEMGE